MANNYFEFKQFTIYQDGSAMKVGTDGVLLGAWANTNNKKHILDIGTGTGLIAIMAAQRNNIAVIDAIEIDTEASKQALENVKRTKWSDRINIVNSSLQDYITDKKYDLIISNPPFFNNSTKAAGKQRTDARHTYSLPHNDIVLFAKKHLADNGVLSLILPVNEGEDFIKFGKENLLYCSKKTFVIPKPDSQPKRLLLEFSLQNCDTQIDCFTSETEKRHIYTEEYKKLTKDFYLAF
jgi:tRNA1Val (adenine37-N6)-methyltransferase